MIYFNYNPNYKGAIFMELRVLQYFLTVTREQSISSAAEYLHLSQPTLSRQLKDLEDELGKQLFVRGNRSVTLTDEGMILRKRAEEIMELVRKTENEISFSDEAIAGDIHIGAGETEGIRILLNGAKELQTRYPMVHFHIISGDSQIVMEQLDRGLIDFGLLLGKMNLSRYDTLKLPAKDTWGVLMRRDSPLAPKDKITPNDLIGQPLIISRQADKNNDLSEWLNKEIGEPNIVATYNLLYNASLMVDEGMGYAICLDKIINTSGDSNLCFRPLEPKLELEMNLVWKKYQISTKAADKFLDILRSSDFLL
jgi:DNA-binding transcriptional LysR family regulator